MSIISVDVKFIASVRNGTKLSLEILKFKGNKVSSVNQHISFGNLINIKGKWQQEISPVLVFIDELSSFERMLRLFTNPPKL